MSVSDILKTECARVLNAAANEPDSRGNDDPDSECTDSITSSIKRFKVEKVPNGDAARTRTALQTWYNTTEAGDTIRL